MKKYFNGAEFDIAIMVLSFIVVMAFITMSNVLDEVFQLVVVEDVIRLILGYTAIISASILIVIKGWQAFEKLSVDNSY